MDNFRESVRPKKRWGQHFLADENIARKIVGSLSSHHLQVLEVGPGRGVLTKYLLPLFPSLKVIEIDPESVGYLNEFLPGLGNSIIQDDFLKKDLKEIFDGHFAIVGNFPYNISSQILFHLIAHRDQVTEVVGMFQKEVAERIVSPPGSKKYGILSVLTGAYYDIDYLFTVSENVFFPAPRVKSSVIRLTRNQTHHLDCNEEFFFTVVKTSFNQRRKTLRNALKILSKHAILSDPLFSLRAEQLSIQDFIRLTILLEDSLANG
ncbi:MAG: 16S rRNA (adenine(1518)-N(6)/adenine(1519)-N(6))-dimethyltransferase RsmA [Lentimicrobiaceae bacterium]|nr:16S rRNA (adenine(1518)-N(6)/adenine(1519)-N(6))-dimethyltransferase RsmA [Lentimicrobiaceae bacterium]